MTAGSLLLAAAPPPVPPVSDVVLVPTDTDPTVPERATTTVKLHITSDPEGARVALVAGSEKRVLCALTPCDVELEPSDEPVALVGTLARHTAARAEVRLAAGEEQTVEATLGERGDRS